MTNPKTYEKQTADILSGGLNLLVPGDQLAKTQALALDNWRSFQDGSLRSRQGHGAALATAGATITSILRSEQGAGDWWVGAGGTLTPLGGGAAVSGFGTQTPISMCAMSGYLWATTQSKQAKHDGVTSKRWIPAAPTSITLTPVAGGGPLTIGNVYTYYCTFVSADGHESGACSADFLPDDPHQTVSIALPTSSDPQVSGCNLYRAGGTLNDAYLINPDPVTPGSTYTDGGGDDATYKQSDRSLLLLGITLVPDAGDPPAAKGCGGPYFGHLMMWNSSSHPNRLWWSAPWKPWSFPGAALDAGNWVDVGDESEEILDVSFFPRMAVIYKTNSIHRIVGDPDDSAATLDLVVGGIGLAAQKARCRYMNTDYFLAGEGLYRMNGDTAVRVSPQLDPIFRGETADTPYTLLNVSGTRSSCAMANRNGRIYFSYPDQSNTANNRTLVYDVARDRWVSDTRGFAALCDEGATGHLLGAVGSTLVPLEFGDHDNGSAFNLIYQTAYGNQGFVENDKIYADLAIEANTGGAALVVSLLYNSGATSEAIGTLNSTSRTLTTFRIGTDPDKLGTEARNVAVRLQGDASTSAPAIVYNATLHYYVLPRPTKTFDTSFSDWGALEPKDIDLFELDLNLPSSASFKVFLDGSTTAAFSATLAATTGRQPLRVMLNPLITGRTVRVVITSDTAFYPYSARGRARVLGCTFDGSNGEVWWSQPQFVGN